MPPHPIAPPQIDEPPSSVVAAILSPMPVPKIWFDALKLESDRAIALAIECGVPINAQYWDSKPA